MSEIFAPPINPIGEAVIHYFNKPLIASGNTKKAVEINAAEQFAHTDAYSDCISLMLTQLREEMYAPVLKERYFPVVARYEVQKIISAARADYRAVRARRVPLQEPLASDVIERTMADLLALVRDEACDQAVETAHRKAVLEGTEQPTESDEVWLLKEHQKLSTSTTPYSQALGKLGVVV